MSDFNEHGERHGYWKVEHTDGYWEGCYEHGKEVGVWRIYDESTNKLTCKWVYDEHQDVLYDIYYYDDHAIDYIYYYNLLHTEEE